MRQLVNHKKYCIYNLLKQFELFFFLNQINENRKFLKYCFSFINQVATIFKTKIILIFFLCFLEKNEEKKRFLLFFLNLNMLIMWKQNKPSLINLSKCFLKKRYYSLLGGKVWTPHSQRIRTFKS